MRMRQARAGTMWDAANKARGTDNDEGAGKHKNFDQLWNDVLKDDPRIPAEAKEALADLPLSLVKKTTTP